VATPHDSAATVYVRFMSQSSEAVVSEETLRILFNNYGPVFDCAIKKLSQDTVRFCSFALFEVIV
jgi:hypothetical protein